ncbi:MAG: glycosyltransferase family 4 protein, partial [Planctomycetes bacterium]|nr:glycosyltransferase family 4 protein [Planctomycetota bacterium]
CFVNRTADRPWLYRLTPRYRTFRSLERAVFGDGGAQVLLLDERERRHYQAAYATPDDRFTLLPPGIARDRRRGDDAAEQRARARRSLQLDERTFVLLMLASNLELKGCDRVLRGLAALPAELRERTALLAVGGAPTAQLRRLVDELGLAANCTFAAGRDDVPDLLQAADLLVHPARRDTTGTVLLEAVAACLPVLCSGAPGYAEHIRRAGAGIALDEPFDQRAFDAALAELRVADLRPRRDAALRYAGEHDLHGMHDRIVDAVEGYSGGGAT